MGSSTHNSAQKLQKYSAGWNVTLHGVTLTTKGEHDRVFRGMKIVSEIVL